MSTKPLFHKAMPGSLAAAVARVRPATPLDDLIGQAVGNWVAHDRTTSRLAEPIAEPHLRGYLEQADQVGRNHGRAACFLFWWPLTAVLFAAAWILALS